MASILKVDTLQKTNGTAPTTTDLGIQAGAGEIVQVHTQYITGTDGFSYSTGTRTLINLIQTTFTPKFATSTLIIEIRICCEFSNAGAVYNTMFYLAKNGSPIGEAAAVGSRLMGIAPPALSYEGTDGASTLESVYLSVIETAGTTSARTYQLGLNNGSNTAGSLSINRTWADADSNGYERGTSLIKITEIKQ